MAYDTKLSDRVRELIAAENLIIVEKEMFGGICFMIDDKMCAGVQHDHLMVRLDPEYAETYLEKEGCVPMTMGSKTMKAFYFIDTDSVNTKKKLSYWINEALAYNKIVEPAKTKKKKK